MPVNMFSYFDVVHFAFRWY